VISYSLLLGRVEEDVGRWISDTLLHVYLLNHNSKIIVAVLQHAIGSLSFAVLLESALVSRNEGSKSTCIFTATRVTLSVTKNRYVRHISCGISRLCSEIGKHIAEPPGASRVVHCPRSFEIRGLLCRLSGMSFLC
jgi:hypothetical protein